MNKPDNIEKQIDDFVRLVKRLTNPSTGYDRLDTMVNHTILYAFYRLPDEIKIDIISARMPDKTRLEEYNDKVSTVEALNTMEMIKLKTSYAKILMWVICGGLMIVFLASIFLHGVSGFEAFTSMIDRFSGVIKTATGFK